MTLRLHTFGSVYLSRDGEILSGAAGQRRLLAILSILATVGDRGISRDKLLSLLWSDGEPDKSRHALTQSLYHIRKALNVEKLFLSGADVRLNPGVLSSDVADFQRAIVEQRLAEAVGVYRGAFLDGFYLNGDPDFEFWVAAERDRFSRQYAAALEALATSAAAAGGRAAEIRWRSRLVDHDPLNGPSVAKLMTCLIAAGDHTAALQRARLHESRMRSALDLPPDRAVADLAADLRRTVASGGYPAVPQTQQATPVRATPIGVQPADLAGGGPRSGTRVSAPPAITIRSRWIWSGAAVAMVAIVGLSRVAASRLANEHASTRPHTVAVAPFSLESVDAGASYLRDGLTDLLASRMADADVKRAADPAMVLRSVQAFGFVADSAKSLPATLRFGNALGADEVVVGSIRSLPGGVSVQATLVDVIEGKVRSSVQVNGSADSLIVLADRIVTGLVLPEVTDRSVRAGEAPREPQTVAPLALRGYRMGRTAYRRGDYHAAMRSFGQSLNQDPEFALAGLWLAMSADRANAAEQHDRGLATAWAHQDQLSTADRAYLRAFAGPRYPEPSSASEALAAWEHVVRAAPDRAEAWYRLGESFYYDAELLGMPDGPSRAASAFRKALQLDPTCQPAWRMLALLLARQGDTAELRRLVAEMPPATGADSGAGAMDVFVRWRVARALRDDRALERIRAAFDDAPSSALRSIAMTGQFDGVSIEDGDRALAILRRRAVTSAERIDVALARHSRALNRGELAEALKITQELGSYEPGFHPELRLRVLDALYAGADRATAVTAAAALERFAAAPLSPAVADSAVRMADLCVLGQWRQAAGDVAGARTAVSALRRGGVPAFPVPVGANPRACAELIDATMAVAAGESSARAKLAHLDSMMLSGPTVGDAMRYANLVVARQYNQLGEPSLAMAALQRRSFMRGWPRYRATGLKLQVSLALALRDSAKAKSAADRLEATSR
jgi:DNA-binding SARP family transcriptional activator/TolB-like protein